MGLKDPSGGQVQLSAVARGGSTEHTFVEQHGSSKMKKNKKKKTRQLYLPAPGETSVGLFGSCCTPRVCISTWKMIYGILIKACVL